MDPSALQLVLLVAAALAAGTVDAIAGGGGLITLPALLAVGVPPHFALGTNKGQSVFGSGSALLSFWRAGAVDRKLARIAFPLAFVGSTAGALLVLRIPRDVLRPLVITLLLSAAAVLTFKRPKDLGARQVDARSALARGAAIALVVGAYDGFFGPGTGTFLIAGYVSFLGISLTRASGDAKVVNFASNLAAVLTFGLKHAVVWRIALPMAAAQLVGGWLGARLAVKGGDKLIRGVVLCVVGALVAKIAWDMTRS